MEKPYLKGFSQFVNENEDHSDFEKVNLEDLKDWLDDDGRTAMIIKGILGGESYEKTSEIDSPSEEVETIELDDIGIKLEIFDAEIEGSMKKVVSIVSLGPGFTEEPVYIFSNM